MSIGIRTTLRNSVKPISISALIVRRLQNKVKGLGHWAAHDFARKNTQSEPPR